METLSAIEMAMRLVGGKHKCLILHYLSGGTKRPRDLLRLLPGISQKMLAEQLRQLSLTGWCCARHSRKCRRAWNTA